MCFCGPAGPASSSSALQGVRLRIASFSPPTRRRPPARRIVASSGECPERIAVIGGGLAGLATTHHILNSTERVARKRGGDSSRIHVTVFDPAAPGTSVGASAVAAGLLHPFTPRVKKKVWQAEKGMDAAIALIEKAQKFAERPLIRHSGILRLAMTSQQVDDFRVARNRFPRELDLLSSTVLVGKLPDPPLNKRGVLHNQGAVVNTPAYLKALWAACASSGRASWSQERVGAFEDLLPDFDSVIVCAGAATRAVSNMASLPILPCRGQNIRFRPRHAGTNPPPYPLISGKYIIPDMFSESSGDLIAGATFEYCDDEATPQESLDYASNLLPPDVERAYDELEAPLGQLSPMLCELYDAVDSVAGVRALPPRSSLGSIPIAGEIKGVPDGKSAWLLTALGSRGLLHAAFLGRTVARAAVGGSDVLIPIDARRVPLEYDELVGLHRPESASKLRDRPRNRQGVNREVDVVTERISSQ